MNVVTWKLSIRADERVDLQTFRRADVGVEAWRGCCGASPRSYSCAMTLPTGFGIVVIKAI
jgi:hypothetical protein